MRRWQRFWDIAPAYLCSVARREWQLGLLAVVGLAPGVAALMAWVNLAVIIDQSPRAVPLSSMAGWLLPPFLIDTLGTQGVLVGTGLVTLLIGCLSLTNIYLVSLQRRNLEIRLLMALGLHRLETFFLLLIEAAVAGLIGSGVGLLGGIIIGWISWPSASRYFQLEATFGLRMLSPLLALGAGMLAAILFMGTAIILSMVDPTRHHRRKSWWLESHRLENQWKSFRSSLLGPLLAGFLTLVVSLTVLSTRTTWVLTGLGFALSLLLTGSGWLLTHSYNRLPTPPSWPLWTMAIQGLARHPNYTTGMVLSFIAGSYGVGLAALTWLQSAANALYPFWVAAMVLVAGASLVLTIAAVAIYERCSEFGLLSTVGARRYQLRLLVLLEYSTVAATSGLVGSCAALVNWIGAGAEGGWMAALGIVLANIGAVTLAAWIGAFPILNWVTSRSPAVLIREGIH